jgi:hypothetical protein
MIVSGFAGLGVSLIGIAAAPSFAIAVLAFGVLGVANVVFFVPNVTLAQELTPPTLRARVFGTRTALLNLTWLPIILGSAVLAESVSVQALLAGAGVFTLGVAVIGSLFHVVRDVA